MPTPTPAPKPSSFSPPVALSLPQKARRRQASRVTSSRGVTNATTAKRLVQTIRPARRTSDRNPLHARRLQSRDAAAPSRSTRSSRPSDDGFAPARAARTPSSRTVGRRRPRSSRRCRTTCRRRRRLPHVLRFATQAPPRATRVQLAPPERRDARYRLRATSATRPSSSCTSSNGGATAPTTGDQPRTSSPGCAPATARHLRRSRKRRK